MFVITEFVSDTLGSFIRAVFFSRIFVLTITNILGSSTVFLTGVDFINALLAAFAFEDPKSAKKSDNLTVFLRFQDLRA